jgi:hypothetical protein
LLYIYVAKKRRIVMRGLIITSKDTGELVAFIPENMIKAVGIYDESGNKSEHATYFFQDHIEGLGKNISANDYGICFCRDWYHKG